MTNSISGFNTNLLNKGRFVLSTRESTLNLDTTHPSHIAGTGDAQRLASERVSTQNFGELLVSQLDGISNKENHAQQLATQYFLNPASVNDHDVTIASVEATLSLNIAKSVIERALESYRSIMSL